MQQGSDVRRRAVSCSQFEILHRPAQKWAPQTARARHARAQPSSLRHLKGGRLVERVEPVEDHDVALVLGERLAAVPLNLFG